MTDQPVDTTPEYVDPEELQAAAKQAETPPKTLNEVAQEVLNGEWGVGQVRRQDLVDAGYDPNEVAEAVKDILNHRT